MTTVKHKVSNDRPTAQTPYGLLYSDTAAYAAYVELLRIHDWLAAFLSDMESLRLTAAEAIKRIDDFSVSLAPEHRSLQTENLDRIRASLAGQSTIPLGVQLTGLRGQTSQHWGYSVGCAAQSCERVPTGHEVPYTGPFPITVERIPGHARGRMTARA